MATNVSCSATLPFSQDGVLAAKAPGLHGALLAAKAAECDHVIVDGTLIATDRCRTPGPAPGVDLWWSGKHSHHGGNVRVASTTPRRCVPTRRSCPR